MDIKHFYKTQRELATALNTIIDQYWEDHINEETMINHVTKIYINNPQKVKKHDDFTTILKQQCGKRRLEVVQKILEMDKHQDITASGRG